VDMFDADKTRMIALPYSKKNYDHNVKPFSSDTGTLRPDGRTDGRTDRRTNRQIYYISMLARDKNSQVRRIHMSKPTMFFLNEPLPSLDY